VRPDYPQQRGSNITQIVITRLATQKIRKSCYPLATAVKKQRNIINEVEIATEKVMKVQKPSYARVDGDFTADTAITVVPDPVQKAVISHLKPGVHEIRRRLTMAC